MDTIKTILKWGGKGAGVFITPKKCAEFLKVMNLCEVSPEDLTEYFTSNSYKTDNGFQYYVGFHSKDYLEQALRFVRGERIAPEPETAKKTANLITVIYHDLKTKAPVIDPSTGKPLSWTGDRNKYLDGYLELAHRAEKILR